MTDELSPQDRESAPELQSGAEQTAVAAPVPAVAAPAPTVAAPAPTVAAPAPAAQSEDVTQAEPAEPTELAEPRPTAPSEPTVAAPLAAKADEQTEHAQTENERADSISPMSAPIVSIGEDLSSAPDQTSKPSSEPPAPSVRRLSPPPKPKSSYPPPEGLATEQSVNGTKPAFAPDKPEEIRQRDAALERPSIPEAARVPSFARPSAGSMPPAASFPASRVPRSTTDASRPPPTLPAGKSPSRYPWMAPATPETVIMKPRATRPMRSSPDASQPFSREPALPPARRSQVSISGDGELPSAPRAAVLPKATARDSSRPAAGPSSQRPRIVPAQLRKETPTVAIQAMRIIAIGSEDAQNSILPVRPVEVKSRPSSPEPSVPEVLRPSTPEPGALVSRAGGHVPPPIPEGILDEAPPPVPPEILEPQPGLELIQLPGTDTSTDAQQVLPLPIPDDDVAAIESERSPVSGPSGTGADDDALPSARRRPPPPRRVSFPSAPATAETQANATPAAVAEAATSVPLLERAVAPVRESAPRQPPPAPSRVPREPGRVPAKPEPPQRVSVDFEEASAARPAGKPEPPQRVSVDLEEAPPAVRPAGKPEPPQRATGETDEGPKAVRPAPRRLWWDELFGEDFSRAMIRLSDAQIDQEVSFIEESLGLAPGAAVLDLGCGAGYHAIELANRGYGIVGYDLSLHQLSLAQEVAQERGQKLNFMQGDMREMAFEEVFDGMYCWNTTFGYFEEEKNVVVAERMFAALKPGGTLLLDVANRDFVAMNQPSSVWYEGDACVCMDDMSVDFFTSRLRVKRSLILDDGRTRECHYSIRLYSLHELGRILHDIGFSVTEASGHPSMPGVFLGQTSPRIIILAQKP